MNEQDKMWLEKCKADWKYTIAIDDYDVYVVDSDSEKKVYTFGDGGYFLKHLLEYIGCYVEFR